MNLELSFFLFVFILAHLFHHMTRVQIP